MNTRPASMKRKIVSILIGGISIVGIYVGLNYLLTLFTVRDIIVSGDAAIVEVNTKKFIGNTLLFPAVSVMRQIQDDNPLIRSIEIKRHFPSTLELVVHKRQPIARLQTNTAIVGIDEDGVITDEVGGTNIPVIRIDVPMVRMGQTMHDTAVAQAVKIIAGTASFLPMQYITIYETSSLRARYQGSDIFFPQKSDIRPILNTLQTLMSGFRIKGLIPKTIDLRFDKPVVQF